MPVRYTNGDVIWRRPNYATIHRMIGNPIYGGAYAYGKSRSVPRYDGRSGIRRKTRDEWLALIPDAHEGYVSWERAEEIRKMVSNNVPSSRHHGAPKHGDTLYSPAFFVAREIAEEPTSGENSRGIDNNKVSLAPEQHMKASISEAAAFMCQRLGHPPLKTGGLLFRLSSGRE